MIEKQLINYLPFMQIFPIQEENLITFDCFV